jgi:hypothetical protein
MRRRFSSRNLWNQKAEDNQLGEKLDIWPAHVLALYNPPDCCTSSIAFSDTTRAEDKHCGVLATLSSATRLT